MSDRTFSGEEVVGAFTVASLWFLNMVRAVDDSQWDLPGLDEWTVRELVAHSVRAYRTVELYLDGTVRDPVPLPSAAAYYRTVLAEEDPHRHIAARAKLEAGDLGEHPVATAEELADRIGRLVDRTPADAPVFTFVGIIAFADYLATRVVELVIHTLDLMAAIGVERPMPPAPGRLVIQVLADLVHDDQLAGVLLSLTGRAALLRGVNALA